MREIGKRLEIAAGLEAGRLWIVEAHDPALILVRIDDARRVLELLELGRRLRAEELAAGECGCHALGPAGVALCPTHLVGGSR